jgi:transposase
MEQKLGKLEVLKNRNSQNSSQPPSANSPYTKSAKSEEFKPKKPHGKPGGKKGHKGSSQQLLEPKEVVPLYPETCSCGCSKFHDPKLYYTHQQIELPKIIMAVTHFLLHKAKCAGCGKINKSTIPLESRTGYGPRLTAFIAELAGGQGDSRTLIQNLCASVLNFKISLGGIQKVLDRASEAILPYYVAIGAEARRQAINHVDETSWYYKGVLCWLWVMTSVNVAFFMIDSRRNKEAYKKLIGDWTGLLVSDGYRLYTNWVGLRQTCLAHLIRDARKLSESKDKEIAQFGKTALAELQRLCHMAHAPPTLGEWRAFYARFIKMIARNHGKKNDAGRFAARLLREIDSLWVFLEREGVSPTNNHAERMLRFAVCWRNRSYGSSSEKGQRWTERMLSLRQTCRLRSMKTYPTLVHAIDSHFKGEKPDLSWISQG